MRTTVGLDTCPTRHPRCLFSQLHILHHRHARYHNMNHPVTPHRTCPASHVRPVGTGGIRARGHRKPIETPLQNRPCPHSNFTGKERDEETGYSYFGARYMDHELMTMWLSVDPMADKYPSISPYAYCAWNPVKLVDPDGMEAIVNDDGWKVDKQNRTITNTSPMGGDNFHHVYGDDCYCK